MFNAYQLYGGEGQSGTEGREIIDPAGNTIELRPPVEVIMWSTAGNDKTVTLPRVNTEFYVARQVTFKKTDPGDGTITIEQSPEGDDKINGENTVTISQQNEVIVIESTGEEWKIWRRYSAGSDPDGALEQPAGNTISFPTQYISALAASQTYTLPDPNQYNGISLIIKRQSASAGTTTIATGDGEDFDGAVNSVNTVSLNTQYQAITLTGSGARWIRIAEFKA